ncbi:YEATS domain-containing protein 2 isoform X2 [Engraulis encrasicolus]|uniref:YEATS domain-containing protein 2 isoform X2 n=1 Tax=Engraulis encrasicolus TaxID=184585 RepID=UPI002FD0F9EF
MSGVKRKIEDVDPDYEEVSQVRENKRSKVVEQNAREATVHKMEAIIKDQFTMEMKNKEHEIEVITQRLNEARRMMDKLRACIVANYYANAGQPKAPETTSRSSTSVLNHPAIKRFLEPPSRSSSPLNQGSEAASIGPSDSEALAQHPSGSHGDRDGTLREVGGSTERRPGRNTGKDTFGVPSSAAVAAAPEPHVTHHSAGDEGSRLYVKKTIVVGNVSKYIAPDKREENDQSTHKWMVYVRGSRKEPTIDHFVRKVWFFLHPSYRPNDLVEVSEPPFHLTRRGWGEFPVRVQIHFKDTRNKRIDIIHNLKLDRTYTGLQTLGAETVVDVELHRSSLGQDFLPKPLPSSSSASSSSASSGSSKGSCMVPSSHGAHSVSGHLSTASPSPLSQDALLGLEKGVAVKTESGRTPCSERTTSRPKLLTEKITLGSHGNSAFQPITGSCKIVPQQSQAPSPSESPGKSFQPITMSCKIVSGNPTAKQSVAAHGSKPSASKVHTGSLLSSGVKVIIKQEPGEVPTQPQPSPQQLMVSTATAQQQHQSSPSAQQFVAVKGGHVITMSPSQKQGGVAAGTGATPSKVLGIPVGSTLQSAVKQAALGSGQILVAKSSPAVSKVMTQKQVVAQGVAKALVSGSGGAAGGAGGQQVHAVTKATGGSSGGGKSGVMATLQLPANNLANLASLPPGTKLYLTTNSKNPSGKGKLLLIPQGAILRATGSGQQSQSAASSGSGSSQSSSGSSSGSSLPSNLSCTSYILKQTPQGTFLVGQPSGSGKQSSSGSSSAHSASGAGGTNQQSIRVTPGQKAAILAQVVGGSQSSQVKMSDGSVKTMTSASAAAAHLSKPGMTTLRMAGGVITTTSTPSSAPTTPTQQAAEGARVPSFPAPASSPASSSPSPKPSSQQHQLLVAANQAAVISAAKNASNAAAAAAMAAAAAAASASASSAAATSKTTTGGTVVNVAKSVAANIPVISLGKGQTGQAVVSMPKSASPSLVTAASLVAGSGGTVSGKAAATLSGMLKLHAGQQSSQPTVLTIPANQLKQLSVGTGPGGVQTILMPVGKVKTEPGVYSCSGPGRRTPTSSSTPGPAPTPATASIKVEQRSESPHELSTEYIENMTQLLTAAVKKFPLIVPEKNEDSHPFCATSVEQYYTWNIGKRRAAELQRAVAVRRMVQDALKRIPALQPVTPPKTREVAQWCRHHGYTPPEPRRTEESIEDILTQIDNEPECPSTLQDCEELCLRVEQLQQLLKTEEEEDSDEPLDVVSVALPCSSSCASSSSSSSAAGLGGPLNPKTEPQGGPTEPSFHLGADPPQQFIRDTAEQVGVTFQPLEVEKNVFAPVLEAMILKATEQFASDVLRGALANAYMKSTQNRPPHEVSVMNVHQSVCSIPSCDFLTNHHMGFEIKETDQTE